MTLDQRGNHDMRRTLPRHVFSQQQDPTLWDDGAYSWRKCTFGFLHGCIIKSSCLCLYSHLWSCLLVLNRATSFRCPSDVHLTIQSTCAIKSESRNNMYCARLSIWVACWRMNHRLKPRQAATSEADLRHLNLNPIQAPRASSEVYFPSYHNSIIANHSNHVQATLWRGIQFSN